MKCDLCLLNKRFEIDVVKIVCCSKNCLCLIVFYFLIGIFGKRFD